MKIIATLALALTAMTARAQSDTLRLNPNILLPEDSIESKSLIGSLNGFLRAAQQDNESNPFVFGPEKLETFIELDEVNGIEKSGRFKDEHFFKPYLTNAMPMKDSGYLIQVSYIGIRENTSFLRASFEFIAHKNGTAFTFSSLLLRNTRNWKTEQTGNNTVHYAGTINRKELKTFGGLTAVYDRKLKVLDKTCDYYCCDNVVEMEHLIGIAYKADYNGRSESAWSSGLGNRKLIVLGNDNGSFDHVDPHDLFHDRLSLAVERSKTNRPVDEGCAYLYGGSWGMSWKEIFQAFKEQVAARKNMNWAEAKEKPVYFKTREYSNSADYIVNALLIRKIERENGFDGVWELLNVGPYEKGNEKYYQTLEKLTGINRANYNEQVGLLIAEEQ